jgi:GntR family transcriptional repressor for pyruvate dehydrogenase complex
MALTDEAIARIRQLITSGELGPGARLPPGPELAARLGVSKSSMREAVSALEHARVLDVRPGDGTYVTSLEPDLLLEGIGFAVELMGDENLAEVLEVRRMLEPLAAEMAAARMDEDILFELRTHLQHMRDAGDDAGVLVVHDIAFHETVAKAAGNQMLASLLRGLDTATVRARVWRAALDGHVADVTIAQHADLYRALAAGDPHLAHAMALVHVATSEGWMREQLFGPPSRATLRRRPTGSRPGRTPGLGPESSR